MEAAACARRLHAAQSAASAARRAYRGRRPEGAARVLERDPCARGARPDRAGLHPLHGRGRALPRDRLYRLRRSARARHSRRGDRGLAARHLHCQRPRRGGAERARRGIEPACGGRHGRTVRDQPARVRPRCDGTRGCHCAVPRAAAARLDPLGAVAGGRVHRPHGARPGSLAMTTLPVTPAPRASGGFWRRTLAMLIKEFIQLKRDRVSFAMIVMIPLVQLLLFGYAINTNPRHLPTAVLLQEQSDLGRSILKAIQNTAYFDVTHIVHNETEFDRLLASGAVLFAIEIPANFERAVRRGDRPALLVAADATDPVAAGSAMAALGTLVQTALVHDRAVPDGAGAPFEIRTHARYNPAANTSLNIVPGLVGTILTMTMLIFTALSVTREIERGTMESLLAILITPVEIMLGKIIPYIIVIVGFVQAALIIAIGIGLFGVPLLGSLLLLALLSTLFITTNL